MNANVHVDTLVSIVLSGDVSGARAYAAAYPETFANVTPGERRRVNFACKKWGAPPVL